MPANCGLPARGKSQHCSIPDACRSPAARQRSQFMPYNYLSNPSIGIPMRGGRGCSLCLVFGLVFFFGSASTVCRPSSVMQLTRGPNHLLAPGSIIFRPSRSETFFHRCQATAYCEGQISTPHHFENPRDSIRRVAFGEHQSAAWIDRCSFPNSPPFKIECRSQQYWIEAPRKTYNEGLEARTSIGPNLSLAK